MDDIFQILIYALIAISFFSSFFKKKKQVQPPQDQLHQQETNAANEKVLESPPSPVQKTETPDILKEFESFFNLSDSPPSPPPKPTVRKHDDREVYEGAKDRKGYIEVPEESFHKRTDSEHTFIDPWDKKRKEVEKRKESITTKIEEQASAYQQTLEKRETAASGIIYDIQKRIQNPASLKEYIIISEIIGKPKALNR